MIRRAWAKISENEFLKNVTILFSGSTLAQAVPILIAPIISRIYLPEHFGEQGLFVSTYTIIAIAAGLRYDMAIMLPKKREEANTLFFISNFFSLSFSMVSAIILFVFKEEIIALFNLRAPAHWLYFLPVAIVLKNLVQTALVLNNRLKKFKRVAKSKIYQTTISSAVILGLGLSGHAGSLQLIVGKLSGLLQNGFYLSFRLKENFKSGNYRLTKAIELIKRYRFFPYFSVANGFLNALSVQLPGFMLIALFDPGIAGLYAFSYRLIILPLNLIAQSIRDVYFQRLSERFNEGSLTRKLIRKNYLKVLRLSILPFIAAFFLAPLVFGPLFGAKWQQAGLYIQIIIPWLFMVFLNMPLSTIPSIMNKQHLLLVYNAMLLIFRFLAIFGGYYFFNDPVASLILFSATGLFFNFIFLKLIFSIINK